MIEIDDKCLQEKLYIAVPAFLKEMLKFQENLKQEEKKGNKKDDEKEESFCIDEF